MHSVNGPLREREYKRSLPFKISTRNYFKTVCGLYRIRFACRCEQPLAFFLDTLVMFLWMVLIRRPESIKPMRNESYLPEDTDWLGSVLFYTDFYPTIQLPSG